MVIAILTTYNRSISTIVATFENSIHLLYILKDTRGNIKDDSTNVDAI
jgi:hypothetical protein